MTNLFDGAGLPKGGVLICCSSHEPRCLGILELASSWSPDIVVLFRYLDSNPRREELHQEMLKAVSIRELRLIEIPFDESQIVASLRSANTALRSAIGRFGKSIVFDISVLIRKHLFLMLSWLFDNNLSNRLYVCYTEPKKYLLGRYLPLSFGVKSIDSVPGFSAAPAMSRPLHLILLLGSEGARAKAVHEFLQPMRTTLLVIDPPRIDGLVDAVYTFNNSLLTTVGRDCVHKVSGIDPWAVKRKLEEIRAMPSKGISDTATAICALGTKAQAVGVFLFLRTARDAPALLYARPLRHNQTFYSEGVGSSHLILSPHDEVLT